MDQQLKRKEFLVDVNHRIIALVLLAQPFISMFQSMVSRDIQIFGISLFEGFNIILTGCSALICIYTTENKKRFYKYFPYLAVLAVYMVLHCWNTYQFDQSKYSFQSPSFVAECYYILRTFLVPLLFMFDLYYSQITKKQLMQIFKAFITIVSFAIVIPNLFGIALQNYGDKFSFCRYSLFDWFTFVNSSKYSYYELSSKGWFLSGNQMSAILFMSFPLTLFLTHRDRKKFDYVLCVVQGLAMTMLGTKTAGIGCFLVLILMVVLELLFKFLKFERKSILAFLCACLVFFSALFPFSPLGYKIQYQVLEGPSRPTESFLDSAAHIDLGNVDEDDDIDYERLKNEATLLKMMDYNNLSTDDKLLIQNYMKTFHSFFGIDNYIYKHYNTLDQSRFWVKYISENPFNDYRVLKTMILKDIYDQNDNPLDRYLGMGQTINYIYTEMDYNYQLYLYGIVGFVVLIGPYLGLIGVLVFRFFKNFRQYFSLETACLYACPMIGLLVAKFSGHVLERVFPLMIISLLIAIGLAHSRILRDGKE